MDTELGYATAVQAATSPKAYKWDPISLDAQRLSPRYAGADPLRVVALFNALLDDVPLKLDEFSSNEDRATYSRLAKQKFAQVPTVPLPVADCSYRYDARNGEMTLYVKVDDLYYLGDDSEANRMERALGYRRAIGIWYSEVIVVLPRGSGNEPLRSARVVDGVPAYGAKLKMPSDKARAASKGFECLLFLRPQFPFIRSIVNYPSSQTSRTLSVHTQLFGAVPELWVYDRGTGEIYAKLK